MICHLLVGIPATLAVVVFGGMYLSSLSGSGETRGWGELFLIFALAWLPFAVISDWAFFYLRRQRRRLLTP
jgi:hypothetical protein